MNENASLRALLSNFVSEKRIVFHHLFEFNYLPASYIHPSRRHLFFDGMLSDRAWTHSQAWPKLSRQMLEYLNLHKTCSFDVSSIESMYFLLPLPNFRNLARHIGAIMIGSSIRLSLGREDVLEWKKKLGDEVFSFVMNCGTLFPEKYIDLKLDRMNDIERIGGSLILSAIRDLPEHILGRALLKFHIEATDLKVDKKAAKNLTNSVLFLLEREWHSLFLTNALVPELTHH